MGINGEEKCMLRCTQRAYSRRIASQRDFEENRFNKSVKLLINRPLLQNREVLAGVASFAHLAGIERIYFIAMS